MMHIQYSQACLLIDLPSIFVNHIGALLYSWKINLFWQELAQSPHSLSLNYLTILVRGTLHSWPSWFYALDLYDMLCGLIQCTKLWQELVLTNLWPHQMVQPPDYKLFLVGCVHKWVWVDTDCRAPQHLLSLEYKKQSIIRVQLYVMKPDLTGKYRVSQKKVWCRKLQYFTMVQYINFETWYLQLLSRCV